MYGNMHNLSMMVAQPSTQQEANRRNAGTVALTPQITPVVSQGKVSQIQVPKVLDAIAASSITATPNPKTIEQTVQKIAATGQGVASTDIVREAAAVVLREVKKGKASALQAAKALQGEPAVQYTICKQALKGASPKDTQIIRKIMGAKWIKRNNLQKLLKLYRNLTERSAVLVKEASILSKKEFFRRTPQNSISNQRY